MLFALDPSSPLSALFSPLTLIVCQTLSRFFRRSEWRTYRRIGHASPHRVRRAVRRRVPARKTPARGADGRVKRLPVHHLIGWVHFFLQFHFHVLERKLERWEMIETLAHWYELNIKSCKIETNPIFSISPEVRSSLWTLFSSFSANPFTHFTTGHK